MLLHYESGGINTGFLPPAEFVAAVTVEEVVFVAMAQRTVVAL